MLKVLSRYGRDDLAVVYVAETSGGAVIECTEAVQPPKSREDKWVLVVSTLRGCPVGCPICDAGGSFEGKLTATEILEQIDFLIASRYPSRFVPCRKFKIQFARMGDPALNDAVIEVLKALPARYDAPGLLPCISTIAPVGREAFFENLLEVKKTLYRGRFQMQFSLHTTDEEARRKLVPTRTWSFQQIAEWGRRFHEPGERKVGLNFAAVRGMPLQPHALAKTFPPEHFMVKLTPVNPTYSALRNGIRGLIDPSDLDQAEKVVEGFRNAGFETVLSIGELEENAIGSNCGMYVQRRSA